MFVARLFQENELLKRDNARLQSEINQLRSEVIECKNEIKTERKECERYFEKQIELRNQRINDLERIIEELSNSQ